MKKYIIIFFMIFVMTITSPIKAQPFQENFNSVRVGLFYNNSARSAYTLYSDTGFKIYIKKEDELLEITNFAHNSLNVCSAKISDFTIKKGGFKNKDEAWKYAEKLTEKNTQSFLFYDGNWSVLTKTYENYRGNFNTIMLKGDSTSISLLLPCFLDNPLVIAPAEQEGLLKIEGTRYRGLLEMSLTENGSIQVINELGLQEYLYGVVPKEISPNWHMEVLKAQAIAARTYVISNLSKWSKYNFDISAGLSDQGYGGYDVENPRTNAAVDETGGKIMLYQGEPIIAFYHADSGGITESCKDVFSADLPYLQATKEIVAANSPHSNWQVSLSKKDIESLLKAANQDIGNIKEISILERSNSGRVKQLAIEGSNGRIILKSSKIRNILGLKSNLFDITGGSNTLSAISANGMIKNVSTKSSNVITKQGNFVLLNNNINILSSNFLKNISYNDEEIYVFYGHGYGHGVGMSQWGAKAMAENGYSYIDILQHYYKDIEIRDVF